MASPGSVLSANAVAPSKPRRSPRIVLGLVALAALVAAAIFVLGRGWEGSHTLTASGTPTDRFDRPDSAAGLGVTDDGRTWQTPAGPWSLDGGRAVPLGANPLPTVWFAIVDASSTSGVIGVTTTTPQEGAGLVLRFQDQENYWSFTASPTTGGAVVRLIVRGVVAREQAIPFAVPEPGSRLEVRFDGNWLDFRFVGMRVAGMYDTTLADATGVGLIAAGGLAISTRFDDFYALAR